MSSTVVTFYLLLYLIVSSILQTLQQGFLGLQAFAFCVVTFHDKHTELGSKGSVGVKYKDNICTQLCLQL